MSIETPTDDPAFDLTKGHRLASRGASARGRPPLRLIGGTATCLALTLSLIAPCGAQAVPSALVAEVTGVESAKGHVRVALCTSDTFPGADCPFHASAPAQLGTTLVRFADIPPGTYAIEAFHDDDDSGKMTFSFLGIPTKGIGFSGTGTARFGPPRFEDAAVEVGVAQVRLTIGLRYL